MAIAYVQKTNGATGVFPSAVTSGNAIVVMIRTGANPSVTSVTDSQSNSYSLVASDTTQDPAMWVYVAQNVTGGSSFTMNITMTGDFAAIWAGEYSGVATASAVDSSASGVKKGTSGSTDLTSNSITTAGSGEVIVLAASQNTFTTYSAGTDFTLRDNVGSLLGVENYITSTSLSSYTAHITSGSTNQYTIGWVALKPTGGGGGTRGLFINATLALGAGGSFFPDRLAN